MGIKADGNIRNYKRRAKTRSILWITVDMPLVKPLNGSKRGGKMSHLLKCAKVPYHYNGLFLVKLDELKTFHKQKKNNQPFKLPDGVLKILELPELPKEKQKKKRKGKQQASSETTPVQKQENDSVEKTSKIAVPVVRQGYLDTYFPKGLKGCTRHSVMQLCHDVGLNVCHTTEKEKDSKGNSLLPEGFHIAGACLKKTNKEDKTNGECIVHSIYGSRGREGKIDYIYDRVVCIDKKNDLTFDDQVQIVHISTENRVCMTYDRKPAQDFSERYLSGVYRFGIDLTLLNPIERGLMIEACMDLERFGRGYRSGYGKIQTKELKFEKVTTINKSVRQGDKFVIIPDIHCEPIPEDYNQALEAWQNYLEEDHS
ncbi:MAG: hypothetical protein ACFFFH_15505 [Candidatus Thorarchaeota archaeon]